MVDSATRRQVLQAVVAGGTLAVLPKMSNAADKLPSEFNVRIFNYLPHVRRSSRQDSAVIAENKRFELAIWFEEEAEVGFALVPNQHDPSGAKDVVVGKDNGVNWETISTTPSLSFKLLSLPNDKVLVDATVVMPEVRSQGFAERKLFVATTTLRYVQPTSYGEQVEFSLPASDKSPTRQLFGLVVDSRKT